MTPNLFTHRTRKIPLFIKPVQGENIVLIFVVLQIAWRRSGGVAEPTVEVVTALNRGLYKYKEEPLIRLLCCLTHHTYDNNVSIIRSLVIFQCVIRIVRPEPTITPPRPVAPPNSCHAPAPPSLFNSCTFPLALVIGLYHSWHLFPSPLLTQLVLPCCLHLFLSTLQYLYCLISNRDCLEFIDSNTIMDSAHGSYWSLEFHTGFSASRKYESSYFFHLGFVLSD